MTDELSPTARSLLSSARDSLAPDAATAARVRARVDAAIAGTAGTASAASVGLSTIAKLSIVALVAGALVGGAVIVSKSSTPSPSEAPAPAAAPAAVAPSAPQPAPAATPAVDEADITIDPPQSPAPKKAKSVAQPQPASLSREVELVGLAMEALKQSKLQMALGAVRTFERETLGRGQLAEDAAAIEIEALCALEDPTWTAKLAAFDRRWPSSAQRARLSTKCHAQ